VEIVDDELGDDTSVIVDPVIIDWKMDPEVETDEAGNMYIALSPLSSIGGLQDSTALPSCRQTQLGLLDSSAH